MPLTPLGECPASGPGTGLGMLPQLAPGSALRYWPLLSRPRYPHSEFEVPLNAVQKSATLAEPRSACRFKFAGTAC